jgi:hypothetical protein
VVVVGVVVAAVVVVVAGVVVVVEFSQGAVCDSGAVGPCWAAAGAATPASATIVTINGLAIRICATL